jgi:hypothetical protein
VFTWHNNLDANSYDMEKLNDKFLCYKFATECIKLTALFFRTGNIQSTRFTIIFGTRVAKECNVLRNLARRSSSLVILLVLFCAEHT